MRTAVTVGAAPGALAWARLNPVTVATGGVVAGALAGVDSGPAVPGLRQAYEAEVRALELFGQSARAAGQDAQATAGMLYAARNALKFKYRALSPAESVIQFEQRNIELYGNPLGPTLNQLREQGKTWEQIIESASRPGGKDLGF